jgi:hypothetical protein
MASYYTAPQCRCLVWHLVSVKDTIDSQPRLGADGTFNSLKAQSFTFRLLQAFSYLFLPLSSVSTGELK